MRGTHTHGWGEKKKHRGAGSRGGRGGSNWLAAKKSLTYSYQKYRLGKKGFVLHSKKEIFKAINIRDIDRITAAKRMKEIDIASLGYNRVLGDGRMTTPVTVKAEQITARAREKIEAAGGKAIESRPRESKAEEK